MINGKEIVCGVREEFKIGDIVDHPLYGKIKIIQWLGSIRNQNRWEHHVKAVIVESSGLMEELQAM